MFEKTSATTTFVNRSRKDFGNLYLIRGVVAVGRVKVSHFTAIRTFLPQEKADQLRTHHPLDRVISLLGNRKPGGTDFVFQQRFFFLLSFPTVLTRSFRFSFLLSTTHIEKSSIN